MPTEMTIEAAMIELNRLKTTERMDIDRDRMAAAIDVVKDAAQFRIKREPIRKECEVKTTFGMIESAYMCCPNCECVPYGVYSFCPHCGQALDWSSL